MSVTLDKKKLSIPASLGASPTLGDVLNWVRTLLPDGHSVVSVAINGKALDGPALTTARAEPAAGLQLHLMSASRKELALTLLGKVTALIEWLTPQHKDVAEMFERGEIQRALHRLSELLSAWQQIQNAYGNLAKMLELSLADLPVHQLTGEAVLNEFCRQLGELQTALKNQDFVLLSDILQYEMDGAIANWRALLEATLGVVEPVAVG